MSSELNEANILMSCGFAMFNVAGSLAHTLSTIIHEGQNTPQSREESMQSAQEAALCGAKTLIFTANAVSSCVNKRPNPLLVAAATVAAAHDTYRAITTPDP